MTTIITMTPNTEILKPRIKCNYTLLIEDKCDFTNDTNTEVYEKLKNEVVETYPKGGHSAGVKIKDDLYFQLTTTDNQLNVLNGNIANNNNLSIIDLGECKDILIKENNLPEDTDLIILKLENLALISNEKSIQYEVYAPGENKKLDLSVCSRVKINIIYPIKLSEETEKVYNDLKSQGYDLFDKYNKFYKDICTPYKSENGHDIILADRNNDFFAKNEIICQANCDYSSFSSESYYVRCSCDVANNEKIEAEEPKRVTSKINIDSFVDILKYSNYKVLLCYKLVFRVVTFYKNLGSIFTMIYFIGYCISFGFFCFKRFSPFEIEIWKLLKKKRDIRNFKVNNQINNNRNEKNNIQNKKLNNSFTNKELDIKYIDKNPNENKNDIIIVNSNIMLNNKNNFKRSIKNIKNKSKKIDDIDKEESKKKEIIERAQNMTYSKNEFKDKIDLNKQDDDNGLQNNNSQKGEFPPKRKLELNEIDDNNKEDIKSNKNLESNIIIYKSKGNDSQKNSNTEKKMLSKDELVIHDNQDINRLLKYERQNTKEELTKKNKIILNDFELNHLDYSNALNLDKRIFLKIYWSLLKREHPIVYTFFAWDDYNLFFIKLSKFFFLITTVMSLDALFFSNDAIHNIYISKGSYNFGHHISHMVLTIIVYEALQVLLNYLTFTDINYYEIKKKKDTITQKEVVNILKCIKYKTIGFYIFTFLVFLFYWYLNSAFCAVYESTQGIFIADSFICLIFAFIYPLILYLAPTGLRKITFILKKINVSKVLYRISQMIPIF